MKNILMKAAAVLTCAFLVGHSMPVYAAEAPVIELKSGEVKEGDSRVTVSCEISGASQVTSGKIRFQYDGENMNLESVNAEDALSGASCEINDCLNGNKKEGEIVVAFAAASPLKTDGSLVEMTFLLGSNVKAGTLLEVSASVEELAADGQDVTAEVKQLSVEVQEATGTEPSDTPTPTPTKTPGDDNNNGDDNQGTGGGNNGGQNNGGSKPSGGGNNGSSSNNNSPKTGDLTNVAAPAAIAGIAVVGVLGLLVWKKKRSI